MQNTYDTTFLGTKGSTDFPIGRLTQSVATTYFPDSTSATVTQQVQTDQRGRTLNAQMQIGVPSSWGVTTALPTYQESMLYNDADQMTTMSTLAGGQGYTYTQVYDPTNGSLQELSNNANNTANLATLTYNEYAQVSGLTLLNGAISSPTSLASEQFSYDANLRPTSLTTNWLPGSGNSGQILGQTRSYDNASNVTSVSTTFAAVPRQTGSGGSETQNFCYDEQNRLIWSGNSGTQPGAGNGTCGEAMLASLLSGASYTDPYTYTNLGQIWQGPLNGQGVAQQYLYCNSAPHQLSGLYPVGTTCATRGSATPVYTASYDPWGNEISRTYNGTTAMLSYDILNRLVQWSAGSGQESYMYDASGQRVLRKSTSGVGMTVYAFGSEEYFYAPNGTFSSCTHYYTLAGHLIAELNGSTLQFELTDALGSVLMSLSSSAVLGEQVYGPYGNQRYTTGSMGTNQGYTGQTNDPLTGLDYYNARYYDAVVGVFLSADSVQGNAQGMDPYAYVAGNPETMTDPTGQFGKCGVADCGSGGGGNPSAVGFSNGGSGNSTTSNSGDPLTPVILVAYAWFVSHFGGHRPPEQSRSGGTFVGASGGDNGDDGSTDFVNSHILNQYRPHTTTTNSSLIPMTLVSGSFGSDGPPRKPRTSITPPPPPGPGGCGGTLYRGLRSDEDPSQGLYPKDPSASKTPSQHIRLGSRAGFASQYISTTKSLDVAMRWAMRSGITRIVEIDPSAVIGTLIDVSNAAGLSAQGINYPSPAYSNAISSQEVLIDGYIPPEAITAIWEPC